MKKMRDTYLQSLSIKYAYESAAKALRKEASIVFSLGDDELAFYLREKADNLEEQARIESDAWEVSHQIK